MIRSARFIFSKIHIPNDGEIVSLSEFYSYIRTSGLIISNLLVSHLFKDVLPPDPVLDQLHSTKKFQSSPKEIKECISSILEDFQAQRLLDPLKPHSRNVSSSLKSDIIPLSILLFNKSECIC